MVKVVPINQGEAIFAPLFDRNISNIHEFTLREEGRKDGTFSQGWSSCDITSSATNFSLEWKGNLILADYDALRFFINFSSSILLSGSVVVDGKRRSLFTDIKGGDAPIEPTGPSLKQKSERVEVTGVTLDFHCIDESSRENYVNIYWIGLLTSDKEKLIEEQLPEYDESSWEGLLNPEGQPGAEHNLFFSPDEIIKMKSRIDEPYFKSMATKLKEEARKWEGFVPEKEIREYVPVEEHMYRFTRIRDRDRTVLEKPIIALAIAGYLFDNPKWTRLAARMILSIAHTPKWYEGPQACMTGSTWHHVCFTEDHYLSAIAIAMGFMGDMFTAAGVNVVMDAIEKAWEVVNKTSEEMGYRWFMNQGLVGNRGRILGAYCLFIHGRDYERYIECSYLDHSKMVHHYLNEEGHGPEGPHYYQYSFVNSVLLWLVYARYKDMDVCDVVPKRFEASIRYVEAMISSNNELGYMNSINTSFYQMFDNVLVAFLTTICKWQRGYGYLGSRINNDQGAEMSSKGMDLLLLLRFMPKKIMEVQTSYNNLEVFKKSGLLCYRFNQPFKGKILFLCERNPMTGHYNEDRGSILLEANGQTLLLDPGTTNYANPASAYMSKRNYHNLAYPEGLSMRICNPRASQSANEAGVGCTTSLDMNDFTYPGPMLEETKELESGIQFGADLKPVYGDEVFIAKRFGELQLDNTGGKLLLRDIWKFKDKYPLNISFLSYAPWIIKGNRAESVVKDMKMMMTFKEKQGLELYLCQDNTMIDSHLNKVYTLRIKTEEAKNIYVCSELTFWPYI